MAKQSKKEERNIIFEDEKIKTQDQESETKSSPIENIISVILGIAVIIVIGAMILNVIRNRDTKQSITEEQKQEEQKKAQEATISARHIVQDGDTLWGIAEKYYNDGFKYKEILKANNMTEQSNLEKGKELIIPKIEGVSMKTDDTLPKTTGTPSPLPTPTKTFGPTGPTGAQEEGKTLSASTDREYKVVKGDTLWDICVRRYNNGYRWVEVARLNNLKNPNLIHPGNVLILPQ